MTNTQYIWMFAFQVLVPLAMAVAGSLLVRRVGAPRGVHACGEMLLWLAVARLATIVFDKVGYHWYRRQPGIVQGDWLPLLDFAHALGRYLDASAIVVGVTAVLTGRKGRES